MSMRINPMRTEDIGNPIIMKKAKSVTFTLTALELDRLVLALAAESMRLEDIANRSPENAKKLWAMIDVMAAIDEKAMVAATKADASFGGF